MYRRGAFHLLARTSRIAGLILKFEVYMGPPLLSRLPIAVFGLAATLLSYTAAAQQPRFPGRGQGDLEYPVRAAGTA